jgi:hypothetical protein
MTASSLLTASTVAAVLRSAALAAERRRRGFTADNLKMAFISNFPAGLLAEHAKWHMDHMNESASGEGVAFLEFHRKFLSQFHAWYDNSAGASAELVAPWPSIPVAVSANLPPAVVQELAKIANAPAAYSTEDDLGIAIHPLHDDLHAAIAETYAEPGMDQPSTAPQYSEFWNLHGMIDQWFTAWQQAHPGS